MILIADSGATKTEWGCVSKDGKTRIGFYSQGYNPNYITGTQIVADIRANLPAELDPTLVDEIYFYGAGVCVVEWADIIEELLPEDAVVIHIERGGSEEEREYRIEGMNEDTCIF